MNLDRISIKMGGSNTSYMTLAKISDFSKLYTTVLFVEKSSPQKINTGDSIQAFNFKNIEQFKGFRPFNAYTQEQLLFLYNQYGSDYLYQTKLHSGDLVRYNGLKYVVLGIVVNTYAQWNMPTPLLFNPTNVNNDYKSLYGSRLTEEQINSKINDNFQAGKYDADMVIPLVDANDFSEYITVIEPRPTKEEVELMFDSVNAEKDLTIKSQKDVFIDTMLRLRGNEINKIKEVNEDLFKGVQTLLLSVNKAVNEQIELLQEPAVEKPERKPRAKKVVEEVEPVLKIAPVVAKQEVKYVELIVYPPSEGVLEIKTFCIVELSVLISNYFRLLKTSTRKLNFNVITDGATYTTQVYIRDDESYSEILQKLVEQYDTFVEPELDWSVFNEKDADIDRVSLNREILEDSFKPVEVEKPKPVEVEKPKPVKVEKPKPVPIEKPKPVKVEKPKPVKVTKPKVEDDLSFLDDLDNIF